MGIGVAAAAVGVGAFFTNPVGIGITMARQGLDRAGLERETLQGPDGKLSLWHGGTGNEVIVLLHGMGNQAGSWVRVASDLAQVGSVFVLDLPGHGESEPHRGPLNLGQMVDGVAALVESTGVETVTLVGNSMGGWVSMLYAAEYPDRVKRLILLNSAGLEYTLPEGLELVPGDREAARRLVEAMSPEGAKPTADFVLDDLVEKIGDGASPRLIAGFDPKYFVDDALGRIVAPTDVVWGTADRLVPQALGERLANELPEGRFHTLEGCGHMPQQQCPRELVPLLFELLD